MLRPLLTSVRRIAGSGSFRGLATAMRPAAADIDAVVVGAGCAGLYTLQRLRSLGMKVRVLEAGSGVGGVWFWNRYPGARCDIESLEYSYQFDDKLAQEWQWSQRFAAQPEILRYLEHVAERFDLHRDIQLNTRVTAASFEEPGLWRVQTEGGTEIRARYCIMASGCLSSTNQPSFEGMDLFKGATYHTGTWPHDGADLTGKRVAVIGTGSSGVQVITSIADEAKELFVFQRTANFVVPARNGMLDADKAAAVKADYRAFREEAKQTPNGHHPGPYGFGTKAAVQVSSAEQRQEYTRRWEHGGLSFLTAFTDLAVDPEANATASQFIRARIREAVKEEATADLLCPRYPIGGKRLCVSDGYYKVFNNPSVHLVDASAGIEAITPDGVRVRGEEYKVDCIVFATGYDAFTGPLLRIDIRGKGGITLRQKWADGPTSYLGLSIAGFPNMFMITGPGSPSVLTNMIPSIEHHVDWVADCLAHMQSRGKNVIETELSAEQGWSEHVEAVATKSLRSSVGSWWNGANIAGKPQRTMPYMGGFHVYLQKCREVVDQGYKGFTMT